MGNAINTSWDNKSYPTFISGLGVFDLYLNTENLMAISEAILYCTFYMIFASMPCAFICQGGHKLRLQITDVVSVNTWLIRDIKETLSSLLSISSEAGSFSPFPPKQQIMKCVLVLWVFSGARLRFSSADTQRDCVSPSVGQICSNYPTFSHTSGFLIDSLLNNALKKKDKASERSVWLMLWHKCYVLLCISKHWYLSYTGTLLTANYCMLSDVSSG